MNKYPKRIVLGVGFPGMNDSDPTDCWLIDDSLFGCINLHSCEDAKSLGRGPKYRLVLERVPGNTREGKKSKDLLEYLKGASK